MPEIGLNIKTFANVQYSVIPGHKGKPACFSDPGTRDEPGYIEINSVVVGGKEVLNLLTEKEIDGIIESIKIIDEGGDYEYLF